MIDVGQGDSFLIEWPHRKKVYLVDTGGTIRFFDEEWRERRSTFEVGKDVVVPYLKARGIRAIDRLILTHGHYDHIGGAQAVGEAIKVKELWYSAGELEAPYEGELLHFFDEMGTSLRFVSEGIIEAEQDSALAVLSPVGTEQNLNNRSIVFWLQLEEVSFLFTGDLELEGEQRLLRQYPELQTDILKVGHHGSLTSSSPEFLERISPKLSLISAGRQNRFGHPHPEVLDHLEQHSISIYRTDLHGAVRLSLRQGRTKIETVQNE